MKLQLEAKELRIRISEAELASLQQQQRVEALLSLSMQTQCRLCIRLEESPPSEAERWRLTATANASLRAELCLSVAELQTYVSTLPNRHGLKWSLPAEHGEIQLTLEVDVRDSIGVRGHRYDDRGSR